MEESDFKSHNKEESAKHAYADPADGAHQHHGDSSREGCVVGLGEGEIMVVIVLLEPNEAGMEALVSSAVLRVFFQEHQRLHLVEELGVGRRLVSTL